MSTLQELLIKKAEMKDDLWGLGAGAYTGKGLARLLGD
jgi:hypothetical protein